MVRLAAIAVGVLLTGSLPHPAGRVQSSLEREIRAEVARYVAAVNARDTRRVADLYARDAGVSTLGDGSIARGWGAIRDAYAGVLGRVRVFRMEIPGDTSVVALGPDAALAYFPYVWTMQAGGRALVQRGAMSLVYRRTRAGWRIVHDHTSSATAAAPGGAPGAGADAGPAAPRRRTVNCVVTRVVDGDTLDCAGAGAVRLTGIDAPERDQRPFASQAADALRALAPVGSRVQLESDVVAQDAYGRRLAYVWVEGTLVNWALVRQGFAVAFTVPPNVQYGDALVAAQAAARSDGAGLWGTGGFACEPARHRRGEC